MKSLSTLLNESVTVVRKKIVNKVGLGMTASEILSRMQRHTKDEVASLTDRMSEIDKEIVQLSAKKSALDKKN